MRGAATKSMSDIVEERQQSRCPPAAPPGCGPQARWLCCSLLTYRPGYSSSLAPRQRAWGPAAKWEVISARALSAQRESLTLIGCRSVHLRWRRRGEAAPRSLDLADLSAEGPKGIS